MVLGKCSSLEHIDQFGIFCVQLVVFPRIDFFKDGGVCYLRFFQFRNNKMKYNNPEKDYSGSFVGYIEKEVF